MKKEDGKINPEHEENTQRRSRSLNFEKMVLDIKWIDVAASIRGYHISTYAIAHYCFEVF